MLRKPAREDGRDNVTVAVEKARTERPALVPMAPATFGAGRDSLEQKIDDLADLLRAAVLTPQPADDAGRNETKAAFVAVAQEFHSALGYIRQLFSEETRGLRGDVQTLLAKLIDQRAEDREEQRAQLAALTTGAERARVQFGADLKDLRAEVDALAAKVAEQRAGDGPWNQMQALRESNQRLADLARDRQQVRAEIEALLEKLAEQREPELAALREEFEAALDASATRLGAQIAQLFEGLREQLRTTVGDVARRQAATWEQRQSQFEAALSHTTEQVRAEVLSEVAELRAFRAAASGQVGEEIAEMRGFRAEFTGQMAEEHERTRAELTRRVDELAQGLRHVVGRELEDTRLEVRGLVIDANRRQDELEAALRDFGRGLAEDLEYQRAVQEHLAGEVGALREEIERLRRPAAPRRAAPRSRKP